jgi:hypothetical protein
MPFLIHWASRHCDDAAGYMYCPACRSRKPAAQGYRKTYLMLFFVPVLPLAQHEAYYRCEGCRSLFDPDAPWPYDFGDHPNPKRWTCSRCGAANPSHCNRCQVCWLEV